jgi:acyl-coenzyme A synthetase/AMP-(fatty) acid ligase
VLHAGHPRPDDIAALVERHRVTVLYSVPTFWAHLVTDARPESLATVRAAVSAGEPLTPALAERARQFLGCPILDGLGSTEVGQTFVSNTMSEQRDGTVGRALPPYDVDVRDEDHGQLPAGEVGGLWVRGPSVLLGYLNPGVEPAVDGEWLATGDRAFVDDEGFVHLQGRVDDIEIVGGINVAPLEVEEVLSRHDQVSEVAVAAVRDALGASRLEAFAVLSPGAADGGKTAEELIALARAELAPFKVPRVVNVVDALPRTPTGKLRRFVLRSGSWTRQDLTSPPA